MKKLAIRYVSYTVLDALKAKFLLLFYVKGVLQFNFFSLLKKLMKFILLLHNAIIIGNIAVYLNLCFFLKKIKISVIKQICIFISVY